MIDFERAKQIIQIASEYFKNVPNEKYINSVAKKFKKRITEENFKYLFQKCIETKTAFPSIAELLEIAEDYKLILSNKENNDIFRLQGCIDCNELGFILYENGKHNAVATRCSCSLGQSFTNIPKREQALSLGYTNNVYRNSVLI